MADFPSKVATETSTNQSQPQEEGRSLSGLVNEVGGMVDSVFIRSIPAMLMLAEIGLGLLHWALIASTYISNLSPAYGWVMFVAVTLWLLTIILFFILLFGVHRKLPAVPWTTVVMSYFGVSTLLYLTAFLTNAASVGPDWTGVYGHLAAASFFGALVTVAYGASAYFAYLDWKGDGGNAAEGTVPQ